LLKKESIKKGIEINIKENKININFHIIVLYGVPIETIAQNIIKTVKYEMKSFTGLEVGKIKIYIEGVKMT
jgi:uncharacterized alkaline shock family protein YloU